MTGRSDTNKYATSDAVILTEARRDHDDPATIVVVTRIVYQYGRWANQTQQIAKRTDTVTGVRWKQSHGDTAPLGQMWWRVFELAVGAQQNMPRTLRWDLDLSGLGLYDAWVRGVIETMVCSIAHELDIDLYRVDAAMCEEAV